MYVRLFGTMEVLDAGGRPVQLSRRHQRWMLAVLLLERGRVVPAERLSALLWEDDPPLRARESISTYAARIRRVLDEAGGPGTGQALMAVAGGYRLDVPADAVDVAQFRSLTDRAARISDPAESERVLREALALWRGPALADAPERLRRRICAELDELRLDALERCLTLGMELGRHGELLPELARLSVEHPTSERFLELHMLALYHAGRTGEALERYRHGCAELSKRLGLDPQPRLRELHRAILRGQPLPIPGTGGSVARSPMVTDQPADAHSDIAAQARGEYQRIRGTTVGADLDRVVDGLLRLTPVLAAQRHPRPLTSTQRREYRLGGTLGSPCRLGIITGSIRAVKGIDVWVNSENTDMEMSRFTEFSISGIIRYWGARRDRAGQVTEDLIAAELAAAVGADRPVAPATALVTGPGSLAASHRVRCVLHVASVEGRPGHGFQPVADLGACVRNGLARIDGLRCGGERGDKRGGEPVRTVLFPILGVGSGGGPLAPTVHTLVDAAVGYLSSKPDTALRGVYFLAYTDLELAALEQTMLATGHLHPDDVTLG